RLRQANAVNSHRCIGHRVAHEGDKARVLCSRPKGAARVKAQCLMDRWRQIADIDLTGLGQVALADRARERLRCVPDLQRKVDAVCDVVLLLCRRWARPVLQRGDGLGAGHTFNTYEPIDAVAALATAEAMPMVRINLAARLRVVVEWAR